tara:strand:- start:166 stop:360 length:195 start_codon:yes stop_codon:yes gene_type:complete
MWKKYTYIYIILFSITAPYAEFHGIVIFSGKGMKSDGETKALFPDRSNSSKIYLQFEMQSNINQ